MGDSKTNVKAQKLEQLKTWADLSLEEKKAWLEENPSMKAKSSKAMAAAYDNSKYIEEFGYDDFLTYKGRKAERDARYKGKVTEDIKDEITGFEKGEDGRSTIRVSPEDAQKIYNLDEEGLKEFLESEYSPWQEMQEKTAEYDKEIEKEKGSKWSQFAAAMRGAIDPYGVDIVRGEGELENKTTAEKAKEGYTEYTKGRNADILSGISANSDRREVERAKVNQQVIEHNAYDSGKLDAEADWDRFANGYEEDDKFGGKIVHDGLQTWKTYTMKDKNGKSASDLLSNFGYNEKKYFASMYRALLQQFGGNEERTRQVMDTMLRDYLADIAGNNGEWEWGRNVARGIAAKASSDIGQLFVGARAMDMYARDMNEAIATGNWGTRASNYLQGKENDGKTERAWWDNANYWNGVDQFATWDFDMIRQIQENGGSSPYQYLTKAGDERSAAVALAEGAKMFGYTIAQMGVSAVLGGTSSLALRGLGFTDDMGRLSQLGGHMVSAIVSGTNAIPISFAYSKGTYDTIKEEANQQIELEKWKRAEKYASDSLDGIDFDNGRFVVREGDYSDEERTTKALNAGVLNKYIQDNLTQREEALVAEYLQRNPEATRRSLDMQSVRNSAIQSLAGEAVSYYAQHLKTQRADELENSGEFAEARQKAEAAATTGFFVNFLIEQARMGAVNYIFKDWMLSPSVRNAKNAGRYVAEDVNGTLQTASSRFAGEAGKKFERFSGMLASTASGFTSNFNDDVTSGFAKAYATTDFNRYVENGFSPNDVAKGARFLTMLTNGLAGAEEKLIDPQTWFDGIVGGLGGVQGIALRAGAVKFLASPARKMYNYNESDVERIAASMGLSVRDYLNDRGYEDAVRRANPLMPDVEVSAEAERLKNERGFAAAVKNGSIADAEKTPEQAAWSISTLSTPEKINKWLFWMPLQQYSDARGREREFDHIVSAGNRVLSTKGAAIEDVIRAISNADLQETSRMTGHPVDEEEARTKYAFANAVQLYKWLNDPVLSQSQKVQQMAQDLQRLANGEVTEQDIAQFIEHEKNKGTYTAEEATKILTENANRLLEMQKAYQNELKTVTESDAFKLIRAQNAAEDVANEYAFQKIMYADRAEREAQEHKDVFGTEHVGTVHDVVALYGNEAAKDAARKAKSKTLTSLEKGIENLKGAIQRLKSRADRIEYAKENGTEEDVKAAKERVRNKRLKISSLEALLAEREERADEIRREIAEINESPVSDRVLSEEEILALDPESMAAIMNPKNLSNYSKKQQTVIKRLTKKLAAKNPDAIQKIQNIAELDARNKDLQKVSERMASSLGTVADYFEYAKSRRGAELENTIYYRNLEEIGNRILEAKSKKKITRIAKGFTPEAMEEWLSNGHEDMREALADAKDISDIRAQARKLLPGLVPLSQNPTAKQVKAWGEFVDLAQQNIDNYLADDSVIDKASAMTSLEEMIDAQTEPAVEEIYNSMMEALKKLGYLRDATKVANREQKKAEEEHKKEQAKKLDGNNFGWNGYKAGDSIYNKNTGDKGIIIEFKKHPQTGKDIAVITWESGSSKGKIAEIASDTKDLYTKEVPKKDTSESKQPAKVEKKEKSSETPEEEKPLASPTGTVDAEGKFTPAPAEAQAQSAAALAGTEVIPVEGAPTVDDANNASEFQQTGFLVGNGLRRYDLGVLTGLGKVVMRIPKNAGDTLDSFFKWCDSNNIHYQDVIDKELAGIVKEFPDVKVQFMQVKEKGMNTHVLEVLEYTPDIAKHHDEDAFGSIVVANGKRWLVIGAVAWPKGKSSDGFFRIAEALRKEAKNSSDINFVHPTMYSNIARITPGYIVKQREGEPTAEKRTLGELFADKERNPHGLSFSNAVLGIMFEKAGFVPMKPLRGGIIYPPGKGLGSMGRTFIMIPSSNNLGYIPIALERDIFVDSLNDGVYKDEIYGVINSLTSSNFEERKEALRELSGYLILDSENNIQVGRAMVTVTVNDREVFSDRLGRDFRKEDFQKIVAENFRVNLTPQNLDSVSRLKELDEAGALRTDASALETVGAGFSIFEVKEDGTPDIVEVKQPSPVQKEVPDIRTSTKINGEDYRERDGQFYDSKNSPVLNTPENAKLYTSIYYNILIQKRGLEPAYISKKGESYYILSSDPNKPFVVKTDKSRNVTVATETQAKQMVARINAEIEKKAREEAARQALDNLGKETPETVAPEVAPAVEAAMNPIATVQPEQASEKPSIPTEPEQVAPAKKSSKKDPNEMTTKSRRELEAEKKRLTFENIINDPVKGEEIFVIAEEKGWDLGETIESAEAAIKSKLAPGTLESITNVDSFIDMLRNCK